MESGDYELTVIVHTVDGKTASYLWTWESVTPGNARSNASGVALRLCGALAANGILGPLKGRAYNATNVVSLEFRGAEELMDGVNDGISVVQSLGE